VYGEVGYRHFCSPSFSLASAVRLEDRFRDRGPSLEEVRAAFQRLADNARARLYGESVDEEKRTRDHNTIDRWQRAEGVDLSEEEERAREKLMDVGFREQ
jgi:hypothetical protein